MQIFLWNCYVSQFLSFGVHISYKLVASSFWLHTMCSLSISPLLSNDGLSSSLKGFIKVLTVVL